MYSELRKKAEKKVQAKMAFYICSVIFFFTSIVLLTISYYLPEISHWLRLPIPIFMMVLGIIYLVAFGLPPYDRLPEDWHEQEIEKEMIRLYHQKKQQLSSLEELSESDVLELNELDRIRDSLDLDDDFRYD